MDETMNKRPSLQFYPADWLKDPGLQMCSMNTIGIWINLLCRMWESKEEGVLQGKQGELALLSGARPGEFKRFLKEAKEHKFCDVLHDVTDSYSNVTIKCRRMNKVFLEREGAKQRMQKHRKKQCCDDVAPYSSSSTSSSKNNSPNSKEFRLAKLLLDLILERKPDYKKPNLQQWSIHTDRMLRLDDRNFAQVEAVIRWCQSDDFWQNNILSTEKLRKHFDKLEMQKSKTQTSSARKCIHCNKIGEYVQKDDTGLPYWLCIDHKPAHKPLVDIPVPQMKEVPGDVNFNDARNKARKNLEIK